VKDSQFAGLTEAPRPCAYTALRQTLASQVTLYVRTRSNPAGVMGAVLREVRRLDPTLPLIRPGLMTQVIAESLWAPRLAARMLAAFGVLAMLLAMGGVYGVLAYSVTQRLPEIAVRMALGARPLDVIWLVVAHGFRFVLLGIAAGVAAALCCMQLVQKLLFGVNAADPAVLGVPVLLFLAMALIALYLPARRAAKVMPMAALKV
jgi:ABC-type antimicrobial peptide transport system permease subunit